MTCHHHTSLNLPQVFFVGAESALISHISQLVNYQNSMIKQGTGKSFLSFNTCHPPLLSPICLTLTHKSIICTIKQKSYCPEDGMYSMLITTMYFPCLQNSSAQHNFDFTLRWPFRKWNNKLSSPPPHWNQNSVSFLNMFPYKIIIIIINSSANKVF